MPVILSSPLGLAADLGARFRDRRLDRGWSREELGSRAQVAMETLKKFERTGQVSLPRLVRLAVALGVVGELESLFLPTRLETLDDIERRARRPKRGRTSE